MDGMSFLGYVIGILIILAIVGYLLFYGILFAVALTVQFWPIVLIAALIIIVGIKSSKEASATQRLDL